MVIGTRYSALVISPGSYFLAKIGDCMVTEIFTPSNDGLVAGRHRFYNDGPHKISPSSIQLNCSDQSATYASDNPITISIHGPVMSFDGDEGYNRTPWQKWIYIAGDVKEMLIIDRYHQVLIPSFPSPTCRSPRFFLLCEYWQQLYTSFIFSLFVSSQ